MTDAGMPLWFRATFFQVAGIAQSPTPMHSFWVTLRANIVRRTLLLSVALFAVPTSIIDVGIVSIVKMPAGAARLC
jgi:hypothetical protein